MPTKFHLKAELQLSSVAPVESQGGQPTLALRSLGDRIFIAAREGDHFDVGKHAVFDVDRGDVAAVVGVHEEDAAAVPDGMTALQPETCHDAWLASIVCKR